MSNSKHDNDNIKQTNVDTKKIINQTFDDAKNKAKKAIDETHKGLPLQTVTNNQEQTVNAVRVIIGNYIESQRDITNSFQSAWSSFFDNFFWISPKRITETYARTVSSISDMTIAVIRIWNETLASTETTRISTEYMRNNAIETSRIAVNDAKMLEEATHISNTTLSSKSSGKVLVVQSELIDFLKEHGIVAEEAISIPAYKRQYPSQDGSMQRMTSWDTYIDCAMKGFNISTIVISPIDMVL